MSPRDYYQAFAVAGGVLVALIVIAVILSRVL